MNVLKYYIACNLSLLQTKVNILYFVGKNNLYKKEQKYFLKSALSSWTYCLKGYVP